MPTSAIRSQRPLAAAVGAGKQIVAATNGHATQSTLGRRVINLDGAVAAAIDVQYVLIMNPIKAVARIYKEGRAEDAAFSPLTARLIEIGATDFEDDLE